MGDCLPAAYIATSYWNVRSSIPVGPPPLAVDSAILEMSLGSLSAHRGFAIPAV